MEHSTLRHMPGMITLHMVKMVEKLAGDAFAEFLQKNSNSRTLA